MEIQRQLTFQDYVAILKRRWVMIGLLTILGGGIAILTARILPKRYTSQTLVLVQQPTVPESYVKAVVSEDINQRLAGMQQQILSRSRLEQLIRRFALYKNEIDQVPMGDLVERLRKTITVTPIQAMAETRAQNLPGFTITVSTDDPHLAQQLCSTITSMFMEENLQLRQDQAQVTTEFLGKQLEDAKAKLDEQDAKLAAFKRRFLGSLPDQEQTNLNLLAGLNSQLEAATEALARAQQDKSFAESVLTQQVAALQATKAGQNPDTLQQQLALLQNQLTSLQAKYTADHPDVIKLKVDIVNLKSKIAEADDLQNSAGTEKAARASVETIQIQQLRAQVHQYDQVIKERASQEDDIQKQIKIYQARVQSSPAVEQEYKQITRDYQTALDFYTDLLKKRDLSAMASDLERQQQGEQFRILDPANLPDNPSFPQVPLFALGGLCGGMALGMALGLLLEMQDTSMRSERDVELALRLPVLAMLPLVTGKTGQSKHQVSILRPGNSKASA
jgi:polysaccharide chain length determinant protein (PEP-CTERM system associated)